MNNKVEDIKNKFIFEAKQSPLLFSDLANMEKYISESYIGRSLIELVQNADDAGASSFLYQKIDKETFIVANNGRPFSIDDLYSLCRSGASSKKRSNNNIGYRGIGFKSVVNYATEVHLISSDISVTFSRKLTKEAIGTNEPVPLIRVPNKFSGNKYNSAINSILNEGYSTLFIFEVSNSDIENEISVFEDSTLLFLKNIKKIDFNKKLIINLEDKNQISDNLYFSTINNGIEKNNWLTYTKNISSISFKIRDNEAVPILSNDPSIYVFMRTNEKFSIPIKINGDFTTDPSRTKIVNDEFTNREIVNISKLLSEIFIKIYDEKEDPYKFLNIFKEFKIGISNHLDIFNINDKIIASFLDNVKEFMLNKYPLNNLYIQNEGIENEDFNKIISFNELNSISFEDEKKMKGLSYILEKIGYKKLPESIIFNSINFLDISQHTKAFILSQYIKNMLLRSEINNFSKIKIFKVTSGDFKCLDDMIGVEKIDAIYESQIREFIDNPDELNSFLKIHNIASSYQIDSQKEEVKSKEIVENTYFRSMNKTVQNWRKVEQNMTILLSENNSSAIDVSKQNVGYDIEVITNNGRKKFIEIKSVSTFGEPFSLTNNEYSKANESREDYVLAIARQTEEKMEVCFIENPIENLKLERQVVQWKWLCDTYEGDISYFDL